VRDRVRFLLGGERRELAGIDPTMTVLDYLRLAERRTGTKEGCNEGDCGACTVVVGRLEEGALRYHTINACIAFVGMLDGAQLLTVEDLRSPDGGFHPAQAAMVIRISSLRFFGVLQLSSSICKVVFKLRKVSSMVQRRRYSLLNSATV
jgi:xanthine dehydrogenase iron-sulfur cluster and FAD-binding subunit A